MRENVLGLLGISVLSPLGQLLVPMLRAPFPTLVLRVINLREPRVGDSDFHIHIKEGMVVVIRVRRISSAARVIGRAKVVAETLSRVKATPDCYARVGSNKEGWSTVTVSRCASMRQLLS